MLSSIAGSLCTTPRSLVTSAIPVSDAAYSPTVMCHALFQSCAHKHGESMHCLTVTTHQPRLCSSAETSQVLQVFQKTRQEWQRLVVRSNDPTNVVQVVQRLAKDLCVAKAKITGAESRPQSQNISSQIPTHLCMCVHVYVCLRENVWEYVCVRVYVCVCACAKNCLEPQVVHRQMPGRTAETTV